MEKNLGSSNIQSSVKKTDNENYGNMEKNVLEYERKAMEGTPFVIHRSDSHGWAAGIAEHKLTGWYETEQELKKVLKGTGRNGLDWDLITGVVLILVEKVLEAKKLTDKINEEA